MMGVGLGWEKGTWGEGRGGVVACEEIVKKMPEKETIISKIKGGGPKGRYKSKERANL